MELSQINEEWLQVVLGKAIITTNCCYLMQVKIPACTLEWAEVVEVAEQYKARSGEHLLRTVIQLKKHWNSKLCLNFKAVMGNDVATSYYSFVMFTHLSGAELDHCMSPNRNC